MFNYNACFESVLCKIKSEGRYRDFLKIARDAKNFPYGVCMQSGRKVVMWCTNDYLGMSCRDLVLEVSANVIKDVGVGSGGTRNISGNSSKIVELESLLAELHKKDRALVFTSGYVANDATLQALSKIIPGLVFFSDEYNHASIISGIRNSRARKYIYKHNDLDSLEQKLSEVDLCAPKIIVFESIYSMNGAVAPIEKICKLAKQYNALTFIDEVHSVGLYGNSGAGICEELGLSNQINIIQGTLGKAYGAIGGYIASDNLFIDAIRSVASGFIFTTSLPPSILAAASTSIKHLMSSSRERELHARQVQKLKITLEKNGIKYFVNDTHIVPIIIGDPELTKLITDTLLEEYKLYIQPINFPTVPKGTERLRITPTPYHTDEMIEELVSALKEVFSRFNLCQKSVAA